MEAENDFINHAGGMFRTVVKAVVEQLSKNESSPNRIETTPLPSEAVTTTEVSSRDGCVECQSQFDVVWLGNYHFIMENSARKARKLCGHVTSIM